MKRGTLLILALLLGSGCYAAPRQLADRDVDAPLPPTLSLPALIERINENNQKLPSLWAKGYFEALIIEEPGGDPSPVLNGTITALHLKPDRLRLKAEKDIFNDVFDMGTDGENLWIGLPLEKQAYVGTLGNLDPEAAAGLPLRPDLILQVLGVNVLPTDLTSWPAPVLEYNPDVGLHMVRFIEPAELGEPRLRVSKQVWYEVPREPGAVPLPVKVILSGDDGQPLLVANLSEHAPVGENPDAPIVATRFLLYFPQTGSKMRIDLDELALERQSRGPSVPNAASFRFTPSDVGAEEVYSLDRQAN